MFKWPPEDVQINLTPSVHAFCLYNCRLSRSFCTFVADRLFFFFFPSPSVSSLFHFTSLHPQPKLNPTSSYYHIYFIYTHTYIYLYIYIDFDLSIPKERGRKKRSEFSLASGCRLITSSIIFFIIPKLSKLAIKFADLQAILSISSFSIIFLISWSFSIKSSRVWR